MNERNVKLLAVLLLLALGAGAFGCDSPGWSEGKLAQYKNWEYGYLLYYPSGSPLSAHGDGGILVLPDDEVTKISVDIYNPRLGSVSDRAEDFVQMIEAGNERGEGEDEDLYLGPQYWDYEILYGDPAIHGDFAEIRYTCLKKAKVGSIDSPKIKTISVRGTILWHKGKHGGNEYIYCFKYETYANCDDCIRLLDISADQFYFYLAGLEMSNG